MAFDPATAILNTVNTVLDRLLPDKAANAAAKAELLKMQLAGDIQAQLAQIDVDKAEAASQSVFVAGWRPFVGWGCGVAYFYAVMVQPCIQFIAVLCHSNFDLTRLPHIDSATTTSLLLALLGMGGLRTLDKYNGTDNGH
jgi:hypothetical protein